WCRIERRRGVRAGAGGRHAESRAPDGRERAQHPPVHGSIVPQLPCSSVDPAAPVDVLPELEWRGLLYQVTDRDALATLLAAEPVTAHAGVEPPQAGLQAGHLMQLLTVPRVPEAAHR